MSRANLLVSLVLGLCALLLAARVATAQATGNVGFELRQGEHKLIPVQLTRGYVVKGTVSVLQGAKVEFDLANQEVSLNVTKFGFVGGGEFYYVAEVDGWYNLVVTNTSFGTVWGELSFLTQPSNLPLRSTSGTLTANWTDAGWKSTLPPPPAPITLGWQFWLVVALVVAALIGVVAVKVAGKVHADRAWNAWWNSLTPEEQLAESRRLEAWWERERKEDEKRERREERGRRLFSTETIECPKCHRFSMVIKTHHNGEQSGKCQNCSYELS